MVDFLKQIFRRAASVRPEDYSPIYVRWDKDGNEYGPFDLITLIMRQRQWSGPPLQARFEDESKWSSYDRFLGILEGLEASNDQIDQLVKKGAITPGAPRPSFKDAITQLDRIATNELTAKTKLPATPYMIKKMDGLGIDYPDGVTRVEAKALVEDHEERTAIQETAEALRKLGIIIPVKLLNITTELSQSVYNEMYELLEILDELRALGIAPEVPDIESLDSLQKLNTQYRDAISEAESVECDLEEKELMVGYDEFRLVGALPKTGMRAIKRLVVERCIADNWSFETHIMEALAEHMPKVRIQRIDV